MSSNQGWSRDCVLHSMAKVILNFFEKVYGLDVSFETIKAKLDDCKPHSGDIAVESVVQAFNQHKRKVQTTFGRFECFPKLYHFLVQESYVKKYMSTISGISLVAVLRASSHAVAIEEWAAGNGKPLKVKGRNSYGDSRITVVVTREDDPLFFAVVPLVSEIVCNKPDEDEAPRCPMLNFADQLSKLREAGCDTYADMLEEEEASFRYGPEGQAAGSPEHWAAGSPTAGAPDAGCLALPPRAAPAAAITTCRGAARSTAAAVRSARAGREKFQAELCCQAHGLMLWTGHPSDPIEGHCRRCGDDSSNCAKNQFGCHDCNIFVCEDCFPEAANEVYQAFPVDEGKKCDDCKGQLERHKVASESPCKVCDRDVSLFYFRGPALDQPDFKCQSCEALFCRSCASKIEAEPSPLGGVRAGAVQQRGGSTKEGKRRERELLCCRHGRLFPERRYHQRSPPCTSGTCSLNDPLKYICEHEECDVFLCSCCFAERARQVYLAYPPDTSKKCTACQGQLEKTFLLDDARQCYKCGSKQWLGEIVCRSSNDVMDFERPDFECQNCSLVFCNMCMTGS